MKGLLCVALLSVLGGSSPAQAAIVARAPINPNGPSPVCTPPRVLCDDLCCPLNYICSSATYTCVKKPPPPPPPPIGNFSITWFTDRAGHVNIIEVHGSGFSAAGAAVDIREDWVTHNSNGDPEYHELAIWSHNFAGQSAFDYSTGVQDCSRVGSPGAGTYGQTATVNVMDWARNVFTTRIPVRTQFGGLCTSANTE